MLASNTSAIDWVTGERTVSLLDKLRLKARDNLLYFVAEGDRHHRKDDEKDAAQNDLNLGQGPLTSVGCKDEEASQ